ncbi:LysM peptidoglycan-binding domain-containing protein [Lentilactobacillus senioris]|uniref:LysM peptidoglycan-binding domain-containing protein n=1 Tax=Lentilactobacillus senioris TaxID=931534 RepID=UPI00227F8DA1|nr:LysM peptidoglycan-binding domain-containing protein [Lentilactobacillus senioris]MCY9807025.1 LysM peptidoglycan-binding domain-containing protein [Lentilactobacillus senioris]
MAKKKTLKTYESAYSKAKSNYNKAKQIQSTNSNKVKELETKYKKANSSEKAKLKEQIAKAKSSTERAKTTVATAKRKYTSAKNNLATFKKNSAANKRKVALKTKKKVIAKMKKDKPGYWKSKRPYVIPKYPGSENSYVFIDNTSENETTSTEMTTNTISPGQYVNHYTQTQPIQRQIEGKLGGSSVSKVSYLKKQFNMLRRWATNGTEIEFHGQKYSSSAVLTSVAANFDQPRDNALAVSVAIQDVKWATSTNKKKSTKKTNTSKTNNTGTKSPTKGDRKKTKPKAGKYLTIKKGDTYWGYHMKFGTSIAKLRSWNGYPDRYLPIGKKVRVK